MPLRGGGVADTERNRSGDLVSRYIKRGILERNGYLDTTLDKLKNKCEPVVITNNARNSHRDKCGLDL